MAIQLPIFDAHKKLTLILWNILLRNTFDFFAESSSLPLSIFQKWIFPYTFFYFWLFPAALLSINSNHRIKYYQHLILASQNDERTPLLSCTESPGCTFVKNQEFNFRDNKTLQQHVFKNFTKVPEVKKRKNAMKDYEPQYKRICENLSKLQNHEGEFVCFISYTVV